MDKWEWSLRDAVDACAQKTKRPFSYEHLRKIIHGTAGRIGDEILQKVAQTFELNFDELKNMQNEDQIVRDFGPEYLYGKEVSEGTHELDTLLAELTEEQRELILVQVRAMVKSNQTKGKVSKVHTIIVREGDRKRR
jgi:HPt (histidine-containing phosphotransfer) domain-containing protein